MKFRIRHAEQIAGMFVLLAIGFVAFILILMGINQRWFAKDFQYTSTFKTGGSLSVGMPITLKGFQIGSVDRVSLNDENFVDIEFHIFDTYIDKVTMNSVLELATSPIGLGGGLVFHPGKSFPGRSNPELLPENSHIPSLDFDRGKRLITDGLVDKPEGEDTITRLIQDVEPILLNVNTTLLSLDSLLNTVEGALAGSGEGPVGELLTDLGRLVRDLSVTVDETTLGVNTVLASLGTISTNLEAASAALAQPQGLVKTLLDPTGSLDTLLNDDNVLFDQITGILLELDATVAGLQSFTDYLMATSPEITVLLEDGRQVLNDAEDVIESISNNPLIRGGIPEQRQQQTTFQSFRDEDF